MTAACGVPHRVITTHRRCHRAHALRVQPVFIKKGKQRTPLVTVEGSERADVGASAEAFAARLDFHERTWEADVKSCGMELFEGVRWGWLKVYNGVLLSAAVLSPDITAGGSGCADGEACERRFVRSLRRLMRHNHAHRTTINIELP